MRNFVLLLALSLSTATAASPLTTKEETSALCSAAASKLGSGETDAAFDVLMPNWPLPPEELKSLSYQTKSQLAMVSARFGAPLGVEFIKSTSAGQSFVQHLYLIKFSNHALRFSCIFYKPKEVCIVNGVTWDDQTAKLFE